jgi:hypothetical protein
MAEPLPATDNVCCYPASIRALDETPSNKAICEPSCGSKARKLYVAEFPAVLDQEEDAALPAGRKRVGRNRSNRLFR